MEKAKLWKKNLKLPEVDGRLICEAHRIYRAVKIICDNIIKDACHYAFV